MPNEVQPHIYLDAFDNQTAFEIGSIIIQYANQMGKYIAISIEKLNHPIFLYVDDNLTADNLNWLRRKANVAKHFEKSSLYIKEMLIEDGDTLEGTYLLDKTEYLAMGGAIPLYVTNAGMIAVITVSGLSDKEDHQLIIEAMRAYQCDR